MRVVVPDSATLAEAAGIIRSGGLVAFPTETVYGLGANALDANAVAGIFAAKGRPAWNPVIVHVASPGDAAALASNWPSDASIIAEHLWPGPITLVLPKRAGIPDVVTAGLAQVAIRIPSHPVALALIRAAGVPLAAPSANRFSEVSPTTAAHVAQSLGDRVGLILDGGPSDVGIESTVLDLSGDTPTILRPGMVSRERLEALLGRTVEQRLLHDGASLAAAGRGTPSPGSAVRHYAPRAEVWLFEPVDAEPARAGALGRHMSGTTKTSPRALLIHVSDEVFAGDIDRVRMPAMPDEYARALYRELRAADDAGAGLLLIELPPRHEQWAAIHDRLTRAAR